MKDSENIFLYAKTDADAAVIRDIEERLGVEAVREQEGEPLDIAPAYLQIDRDGLSLIENGHGLRGDFRKLQPRLKPNNLNGELLVKAARFKGAKDGEMLSAVDATEGLGEDAFLLAGAGFQVNLYERNPVIAALLYDALRRGLAEPALEQVIAGCSCTARTVLKRWKNRQYIRMSWFLTLCFQRDRKAASLRRSFSCCSSWSSPALKRMHCSRQRFPAAHAES